MTNPSALIGALTTLEGMSIMASTQTAGGSGFKQDMHRVGQGVDALKADVHNIAHGAADAARSGVAELRLGAQGAVDTARDKVDDMKDMALDKYDGVKAAAADGTEAFKAVIVRNPVASLGIALGVGMLCGMAMCRSRS